MSSAIYALRFRSKQFYVGSSVDPEKRFLQHRQSCFSKKPSNSFLARCWKKFGEPKLIILKEVPENKLLIEEQLFLDILFQGNKAPIDKTCLNLNPHADRPRTWKKRKPKLTKTNNS